MLIADLEPKEVWKNFYAITQVPHPSGHLEKIQEFLLAWAKEHNIEAYKDGGENIVMRKPATPGYENLKPVVMQAHMDMVPQKLADSAHNFETDPIKTYIDGDWVKAEGTTLGADDGIGVAVIMAVLGSDDVEHGPIEALITSDEETCMYGVNHLAADTLHGEILLNIDNETMGEFVVGSAGGVNVTAKKQLVPEKTEDNLKALKITLKGLRGGHSGLEICENRANANKLMARLLQSITVNCKARLAQWNGGNMRNAIPRESEAVIVFPEESREKILMTIKDYLDIFTNEYRGVENNILILSEEAEVPQEVLSEKDQNELLLAVIACHDGVLRNIPSMPNIVETSSNLAIIKVVPSAAEVLILARSSSETMIDYVTDMLSSCFIMIGMKVEMDGRYGAWQPNFDSHITAKMVEVYKNLFNEDALVQVVHAGLECSLIGEVYPNMDLVSFGPTLRSPHTPDERCNIPSVAKFWIFFKELLKNIPVKE